MQTKIRIKFIDKTESEFEITHIGTSGSFVKTAGRDPLPRTGNTTSKASDLSLVANAKLLILLGQVIDPAISSGNGKFINSTKSSAVSWQRL